MVVQLFFKHSRLIEQPCTAIVVYNVFLKNYIFPQLNVRKITAVFIFNNYGINHFQFCKAHRFPADSWPRS